MTMMDLARIIRGGGATLGKDIKSVRKRFTQVEKRQADMEDQQNNMEQKLHVVGQTGKSADRSANVGVDKTMGLEKKYRDREEGEPCEHVQQ